MNDRAEEALIDKIRSLTPDQQAEVEDFVDFLASRKRRREAVERLRALQARVASEDISDPEMAEVVQAVKQVRAELRAERERAGHS